jgi:holliday junction DNA helicase RuvA
MIGFLSGIVMAKLRSELWINVAGVGYRVKVGDKLGQAVEVETEISLFTHMAVREDAITLFGFEDLQQLQMFELLIEVSGIGPKTALVIVGSQSPGHIETAVRQADVGFFQKVPGIGKKGAQRIIVDLKGKMPSLKELDLQEVEADEDVLAALRQFGFREKEIQAALAKIDSSLAIEVQVKEGLKLLGKR